MWRLGSALQAEGKEPEALDAYIKSYSIDKPSLAHYNTVEALYKKVNGSTEGLEAKVGRSPIADVPIQEVAKMPFLQQLPDLAIAISPYVMVTVFFMGMYMLVPNTRVLWRPALIGALAGVTFGYWIPIWISDYWPLVVGGKPIASWVPYTIIGFEVMVLIGSLATVLGLFINARIPRITQTVGYDPRFSDGSFGIWVECRPDEQDTVRRLMKEKGAEEVRGER